MNSISSTAKKTIVINIILYLIGITVYILHFNMHVSPCIVYGMLLAMIVDAVILFSKYLLKAFKEARTKDHNSFYYSDTIINSILHQKRNMRK